MKRFKKVLALVLAGVMALALLTACGETDPDKLIPADGSYEIVKAINDKAVSNGKAEVTYSVKYSEITKKLLTNWLENRTKPSAYADGYNAIVKDLGDVKVVVGLTSSTSYPTAVGTNPAYTTTTFNADSIVGDENYTSASHVGVAFYPAGNGMTYRLVCLYKVPNQ